MQIKRKKTRKRKFTFLFIVVIILTTIIGVTSASAMEDSEVISILSKNSDLFNQNDIISSMFRSLGWMFTWLFTTLAETAAELYDVCFGFVDFTKYTPVKNFIDKWQPVFVALVCLSILLIGILLSVGWEKKPKILINILIAITVVTSSTFFINTLNKFITQDVRDEILGGSSSASAVYNIVGNNIHDLVWLDNNVGLENLNKSNNAKKVYSSFNKNKFNNLEINELVEPGSLSDEAEDIISNKIVDVTTNGSTKRELEELEDGAMGIEMLSEYYYRYNIDFLVVLLELASIFLVYIFMSYKVIRVIYEIVVHRFLAYLYAANLNNNQKILKILDSLKDSYIILILTTVLIKFYLLATKFISAWDIAGLTKGFILLFIAFTVIDGPNLIQKLTGMDVGLSDGMGKFMSMMYGSRAVAGGVKGAFNMAKGVGKTAKGGFNKAKDMFSGNKGNSATENMPRSSSNDGRDNVLNSQNNQSNNNQANNNISQNNQNTNNQNNHQNNTEDVRVGTDNQNNISSQNDNTNGNNGYADNVPQENTASMPNTNNSETNNNAALSSEQGKPSGGYQMNNIGHVPSKNDALNGTSGNNQQNNQSMKQMEKDLNGKNSFNSSSIPTSSNKPIDSNSNMFNRTPSKSIPKINFGGNENMKQNDPNSKNDKATDRKKFFE